MIICNKCKYAVLPSQIDAHFTPQRPHGFVKQERERIAKEEAKVSALVLNEEALKQCEFQFPVDTAEPIPALEALQTRGLRCTFGCEEGEVCFYVCRLRQQMQEHIWKQHNWKSKNKGGWPKKDAHQAIPQVPWRTGVQYHGRTPRESIHGSEEPVGLGT